MPRTKKSKKPPPNSTNSPDSRQHTAIPIPIINTPNEALLNTVSSNITAGSVLSSFQGSPSASLSQADFIRLGQALARSATPAHFIPASPQGLIAFHQAHLNSNSVTPAGSQPTVVTPNNSMTESPAAKRARGRPKRIEPQEEKPVQSSWFMEGEDGCSDMDIVALWCADDDNFNQWKSGIPSKIANAGVLSEYMAKKNRPGRPPRECNKKIAWLEEKFKKAFGVVNSTGQGVLNNEDYRQELKDMDLLSATVNSDGKEEWIGKICQNSQARGRYQAPKHGTPLEKALAICPWYCVLESTMLERSNIIPEATHDTLGNTSLNSINSNLTLQDSTNDVKESDEDHSDTQSNQNPVVSDVEDGEEKIKLDVLKETKISVPQRHNKRMRRDSRNGSVPRDPLGLQTLITNFLPSKAERQADAKAERKKEKKQAQLTANIALAIATMSCNRKEDIELKRSQLRGDTVTKFMGMGDTFEEAFRKASLMYPEPRPTPTQEFVQGSTKDLTEKDERAESDRSSEQESNENSSAESVY
ncbi:hypothetical protein DFH28DRAFT_924507 [Melampsora americana]|nr:hypothetical protein DFH28DRAFT_924507 [Melampsora americana]